MLLETSSDDDKSDPVLNLREPKRHQLRLQRQTVWPGFTRLSENSLQFRFKVRNIGERLAKY